MSIAAKVLLWTVPSEANCLCCLADNERCIFVVPFLWPAFLLLQCAWFVCFSILLV